jgi:hypothetical protein
MINNRYKFAVRKQENPEKKVKKIIESRKAIKKTINLFF